MNKDRLDHSKFVDLEGGLKGKTIVSKLNMDFELLTQFKTINAFHAQVGDQHIGA